MSNILTPDEMAATHQLGGQLGSYPYQKVRGIISLLVFSFMAISMGIIGIPLALAALVATFVYLHPTRDVSDLLILVLAVFFLAFFVWGLWISIKGIVTCSRYFGSIIYLYSRGLILIKGRKARLLRWEQVSDVQEKEKRAYLRGIYTGTSFTYTLRLVDGKKLIFTSLIKDVTDLGEGIALLTRQHDRL
jgi:hypothetical protein